MRLVRSSLPGLLIVLGLVPCARADGWRPRFGVEASGRYGIVSRESGSPRFSLADADYGAGWAAGVTADWGIGPAWGVASGLRYVEAGESQTVEVTMSGGGSSALARGEYHDTWRWLALPIRARFRTGALPLSLEAGPEVQVLLAARSRQELFDAAAPRALPGIREARSAQIFEEGGTFGGDRDVTDLYQRTNVVLGGGVRYALPFQSGRLVAHLRYAYGLTDIMKGDSIERRTRAVELGAGWQW